MAAESYKYCWKFWNDLWIRGILSVIARKQHYKAKTEQKSKWQLLTLANWEPEVISESGTAKFGIWQLQRIRPNVKTLYPSDGNKYERFFSYSLLTNKFEIQWKYLTIKKSLFVPLVSA